MSESTNGPSFPTARIVTGDRFQLGTLRVCPGLKKHLYAVLGGKDDYGFGMGGCIARHMRGDWGDVSDADKSINDCGIASELEPAKRFRVISVYSLAGVRFRIVTEADRSSTSVDPIDPLDDE